MAEKEFRGQELTPAEATAITIAALIEGARTTHWKNRTQKKMLDKVMDAMRSSLANGESINQAITGVLGGTVDGVPTTGVMGTAKRDMDALINTSIAAVATQARLLTYQKNSEYIKWIQQISVLDNKTSDICIAYSGQIWDTRTLLPVAPSTLPFRNGPPRHWNCRSTLIPIIKSWQELGIPAAALTKKQKLQLDGKPPKEISFDQWLRKKPKSFQDKVLGPTRAQLWRSGTITLTQLVDMRGNPLNLDQLAKKIKNRRKR
jgi:SPP1 gp7 family putative phage head morphogenesis protein